MTRLDSGPEGHQIATKCPNSPVACHRLPHFFPSGVTLFNSIDTGSAGGTPPQPPTLLVLVLSSSSWKRVRERGGLKRRCLGTL
jgi:hypothetical protein